MKYSVMYMNIFISIKNSHPQGIHSIKIQHQCMEFLIFMRIDLYFINILNGKGYQYFLGFISFCYIYYNCNTI